MTQKYEVLVCRIGYAHHSIEVEADSKKEAKEKALEEAGNHEFSEHTSEYKVSHMITINQNIGDSNA